MPCSYFHHIKSFADCLPTIYSLFFLHFPPFQQGRLHFLICKVTICFGLAKIVVIISVYLLKMLPALVSFSKCYDLDDKCYSHPNNPIHFIKHYIRIFSSLTYEILLTIVTEDSYLQMTSNISLYLTGFLFI